MDYSGNNRGIGYDQDALYVCEVEGWLIKLKAALFDGKEQHYG